MCAVIGAIIRKPSADDFSLIRRVFLESKIRGMHATGMSVLPHWSKEIQTFKEPVPADKFVHLDNLEDCVAKDGNLYLIGHCRYSTSDLEYNQPLYNSEKSIVHNGVITQELPHRWKELYGYDCITKNDSELVLHSEDPLEEFPNMSMGVCELSIDKKLTVYRSGKRPLYMTTLPNGVLVTSTKDIIKRADPSAEPEVMDANTYCTITIGTHLTLDYETVNNKAKDYQYEV